MAKTIARLEPRRKQYPWSQWANGKAWRAVKGDDFECSIRGFLSALYRHAYENKMKVRTVQREEQGVVDFKFSK